MAGGGGGRQAPNCHFVLGHPLGTATGCPNWAAQWAHLGYFEKKMACNLNNFEKNGAACMRTRARLRHLAIVGGTHSWHHFYLGCCNFKQSKPHVHIMPILKVLCQTPDGRLKIRGILTEDDSAAFSPTVQAPVACLCHSTVVVGHPVFKHIVLGNHRARHHRHFFFFALLVLLFTHVWP